MPVSNLSLAKSLTELTVLIQKTGRNSQHSVMCLEFTFCNVNASKAKTTFLTANGKYLINGKY